MDNQEGKNMEQKSETEQPAVTDEKVVTDDKVVADNKAATSNNVVAGNTPVTAYKVRNEKVYSGRVRDIRYYCSFITIIATVLFVFIAILATWGMFGDGTTAIVWKAFSSMATIGFGALIIAALAPLLDR